MSIRVTPKAPDDVVEYTVRFKGLGTDTIASIDVVGSGVTIASPSPTFTDDEVVVWVSGGTLNTTGTVTVEITTAGSRVFSRAMDIPIKVL